MIPRRSRALRPAVLDGGRPIVTSEACELPRTRTIACYEQRSRFAIYRCPTFNTCPVLVLVKYQHMRWPSSSKKVSATDTRKCLSSDTPCCHKLLIIHQDREGAEDETWLSTSLSSSILLHRSSFRAIDKRITLLD